MTFFKEDKEKFCALIEKYFCDCKKYGYLNFNTWREGRIDGEIQEVILSVLQEHINTIAEVLFNTNPDAERGYKDDYSWFDN